MNELDELKWCSTYNVEGHRFVFCYFVLYLFFYRNSVSIACFHGDHFQWRTCLLFFVEFYSLKVSYSQTKPRISAEFNVSVCPGPPVIVVPLEIQHCNRALETKDDCLDLELLLPVTCACSRGGSFSLFVMVEGQLLWQAGGGRDSHALKRTYSWSDSIKKNKSI